MSQVVLSFDNGFKETHVLGFVCVFVMSRVDFEQDNSVVFLCGKRWNS